MCLGIPGRIVEVWGDHDLLNGTVDFGGVVKQVCLAYVPDVRPGDYVIVHVGFAITKIDEEEAQRTLAVLAEMGDLLSTELADGSAALDSLTAPGGPADLDRVTAPGGPDSSGGQDRVTAPGGPGDAGGQDRVTAPGGPGDPGGHDGSTTPSAPAGRS